VLQQHHQDEEYNDEESDDEQHDSEENDDGRAENESGDEREDGGKEVEDPDMGQDREDNHLDHGHRIHLESSPLTSLPDEEELPSNKHQRSPSSPSIKDGRKRGKIAEPADLEPQSVGFPTTSRKRPRPKRRGKADDKQHLVANIGGMKKLGA
jgi:hypothetical protein